MTDNLFLVAVTDARVACENEPDITERVRKAMRQALKFWLSSEDAFQFRAAVAAAIMESPEDEKSRIERSIKALAAISRAIAGLQLEEDSFDPGPKPVPLLALWKECKAEVA